MKKFTLLFSLLFVMVFAVQAADVKAGKDYTVINANAPDTKTVTVIEFFNLGCPICCYVDSALEQWVKDKPAYVNFIRQSVAWNSRWTHYAQLYTLLEDKGLTTSAVPVLFNAIHGKDCHQEDTGLSTDDFVKILRAKPYNIRPKLVKAAFTDSESSALLQKNTASLMKLYQFSGVPIFIVNNKYKVTLTGGRDAPEKLVKTLSYLAKKIQQNSKRK